MKIIKTNLDLETIKQYLAIEINESSHFALIEKGFEPVTNSINIVFDKENLSEARNLLMESGYYSSDTLHLVGKKNDEIHIVKLEDILYIEGINNDTYLHTMNEEYQIKQKLYELETLLFDKQFIRISKSYIVSIQKIKNIKPTFQGKLILKLENKTELEVTRHYLQGFRSYLGM